MLTDWTADAPGKETRLLPGGDRRAQYSREAAVCFKKMQIQAFGFYMLITNSNK